MNRDRREFIKGLGLSTAIAPFISNLPSLAFDNQAARKQRLIIMFSPNGVIPENFWPEETGDSFQLKSSLQPLAPFQNRTLFLRGIADKVMGDGDDHMRGIGCLLTGIELFPGNIQGGAFTPAGWSRGPSIDQTIAKYLQSKNATKTRFGSLEFGVLVPRRADTWTRMVYAGPNQPVAPVSDPYQMFSRLYGDAQYRDGLGFSLDAVREDLKKVRQQLSVEDRKLLDEHETFVNEYKSNIQESANHNTDHAVPELDPSVELIGDSMPKLSKMQIDLLVNALQNDFARVATLQYTCSVGQARMTWLGVEEAHHTLSHEPNSNVEARKKLSDIDHWFCEQLAYLATKLAATPEPGGPGTMLDNTMIVWTNELGAGNSHSREDNPFVLVGGGMGFKMGRSLQFDQTPHNRLLMALAHSFGNHVESIGNPLYCEAGPLVLS